MKTPTKATLTIEFRMVDPDELSEHFECDCEDHHPGSHLATGIDIKLSTPEGHTIADLNTSNPQTYIDNGYVLAMIEQILAGLQSPRGTSFEYATEEAVNKMDAAKKAVAPLNKLLEELESSQCGEC